MKKILIKNEFDVERYEFLKFLKKCQLVLFSLLILVVDRRSYKG